MDCTENYTRFAVCECLRCVEKEKKQESCQISISVNSVAKPTGDKEFVQTEHGDDNGKQDEGDSIKLTQVKTIFQRLTLKEIEEWKGPIHYVAHHAVVPPEKKTTPTRIVFNSSASFNGHRAKST